MTIALVSTVQTSQGTPSTHAAITGIATGDLYIDIAHNTGGGTVPVLDPTSTFTTITTGTDGGGRNFTYGSRLRTGTEGALATTSGSTVLADIFFALTGVDQTTPIESIVSANGTASATRTVTGSTPTKDNCWHVVVYANTVNANTISTPPPGYTLLGNRAVSGQGNIYAYYKDLGAGSSGVSTGNVDAVYPGTASGRVVGFIVRPAAATLPSLSIGDVTVDRQDGTASAPVTLSSPAPVGGVTVNYATQDDTATAPAYYTAATGTLTFAEGESTKNVTVSIVP